MSVFRAQGLHAHLVELAESALLGSLVAEVGARVPGLPRWGGPVLGERPDHRGGLFGSQGYPTAALVLEVVHLLADHLCSVAEPLEHFEVFEHGRNHLGVPGGADHFGEPVDKGTPSGRVRPEDVAGALGCPVDGIGHESQHYRRGPGGRGALRCLPPPGSAPAARYHPVDVIDGVDAADQVEEAVEVGWVADLEVEAHLGHPVNAAGRRVSADHVDLVVG